MGRPTSKKQKVVVTPDKMKMVRLRPIRLLILTFENIKGRDFMKYCGMQHVQSVSSYNGNIYFHTIVISLTVIIGHKNWKHCIGELLNCFVVSSL